MDTLTPESQGLGRLSDAEYLKAMQAINRAILNPWSSQAL